MDGSPRFQYLAAACCNLLTASFGGACGWTSVNFLLLQSDESPLASGKLTLSEASWVVACLTFGGLWGNIVFGYIAEHFGRKWPLILVAIPQIIGWVIILMAQNVYHLYIARLMLGFVGGACYVLIPLFTTEISDDNIRGTLGSYIEVACNVGMLFELVASNYCSYQTQALIFMVFPAVFILAFCVFPETPAFLGRRNKLAYEKSLIFYGGFKSRTEQNSNSSVSKSLRDVTQLQPQASTSNEMITASAKVAFSDFRTPEAKKALVLGAGLIILNQFCGCFAMLSYSASIFTESGSTLTPNQSSIVIGIIQCLGAYSSTMFVDKAGRKFLLLLSAFGTGIGLSCLGTYSYLKTLGYNLEAFTWIPLASFSFVIFIANCGILSVHFLIIAEILPEKIKNFGSSICIALMWIFGFLLVRLYPIVSVQIGLHGSMFVFTGFAFAGALFVLFMLPETKGKSHQEIMRLLQR